MPRQVKVFYSWQSDLPNATNRGFIEKALRNAAKRIAADDSLAIEPVVDRDTQGLSGSPDISEAIFRKIDDCDIFVADVSIVSPAGSARRTPNPNVLLELGYAIKTLGPARVILVQNTHYGPPEELPFDLRTRRVLAYSTSPGGEAQSEDRAKLGTGLDGALRATLAAVDARREGSEDVAVELKRILHDPAQRMRVHELVVDATSRVHDLLETEDVASPYSEAEVLARVARYESWVTPLERIFVLIGRWSEPHQDEYFTRSLERIADLGIRGAYSDLWLNLRLYPALRLIYAGGIAATSAGNYRTLHALLDGPTIANPKSARSEPALLLVNSATVMPVEVGRRLPEMERRHVPLSDYLHRSLFSHFSTEVGGGSRWDDLFDRFEYFAALVFADMRVRRDFPWFWAPIGRFGWRKRGVVGASLQDEANRAGDNWAPLLAGFFGGSLDRFSEARRLVDEEIRRLNWD